MMTRVFTLGVSAALLTRGAHSSSAEVQQQTRVDLQQSQFLASCYDAREAMQNVTECFSIAESVRDADTFAEAAGVGESLCAACEVDAFAPLVDLFRENCRGNPPPSNTFGVNFVEDYEAASAVLLICGETGDAECYSQAHWLEGPANFDEEAPSQCDLPCGLDYAAATNIDSEECGRVEYDALYACSAENFLDVLRSADCQVTALSIEIDPTAETVAEYCNSEDSGTFCPDRYAALEARRQLAGCKDAGFGLENECSDARLSCLADENGDICYIKELESFRDELNTTPNPLESRIIQVCEIDKLERSASASCTSECIEVVNAAIEEFGCCFPSLLNSCPNIDIGETLTTLEVLQQVCALPEVPIEFCAARDVNPTPTGTTPGAGGVASVSPLLFTAAIPLVVSVAGSL